MKIRFRLVCLAGLFLVITTSVSMLLIYIPMLINPKVFSGKVDFGAAFIGSAMGQVTLLMAMQLMDWLYEGEKNDIDNLEFKT